MARDVTRRRFVKIGSAGTVIGLAGCTTTEDPGNGDGGGGNGDGGGGNGDGTATDTDSGSGGNGNQDPIPIGSLFPLTGFWSENGTAIRDAIQFTVDEINDAGGPLGRPLEHIDSDNEGADAQVAVQKMNKMISQDGIVGHIGPTSGTLPAVKGIVEENEVVAISPAAGTHELWREGPPWWWRTVADDFLETFAVVKAVQDLGAGSAAIVGVENQASKSINAQIEDIAADAGLDITTTVLLPTGQSEASSTTLKALSTEPDKLILTCETGQVPSILQTMLQNGYDSSDALITSEARSTDTFNQVSDPQIIEGAWSMSASADTESEKYQNWAERFKSTTGVENVHSFAPPAFDATNVLALAMHAADSTAGADIADQMRPITNDPGKKVSTFEAGRDALDNGEEINYDGITGPINFDEYGNVSGSFAVYQATGTEWQVDHIIGPQAVRDFQDSIGG
jgi:ABC-type branched-subunit amino acid transport system substrate-binding protein